jgi:simple sugar transport system permease protein
MGRSHPVGIIPAAILFGMLYQGGAEIAFDMPNISRDMIVIIQGLVILFAGALEHMFRPAFQRLFMRLASRNTATAVKAGE